MKNNAVHFDASCDTNEVELKERPTWSNKTEFLMSCIQTSVGLGNIWRFPFTAYENGGGAFLIPYVIVLFIIGKPMYYLEMFLGQFTSQSSVKIWEINPAFRGMCEANYFDVFEKIIYFFFICRCWSWSNNRLNLCHHILFIVGCINRLLFLCLIFVTTTVVTVPSRMGSSLRWFHFEG